MTDHNDLEALAEEILAAGEQQQTAPNAMERARDAGARLTSGMERGGATRYDPATFMDKPDKDAPALLPQQGRGGSSGSTRYVMSAGISSLDHAVREARRRPDDATLGETKAAATAWAEFLTAADEARAAVVDVPAAMRRAADARSAALAEAAGPVVLPSVADARAYAETLAGRALRHALDLRKTYDDVVEETAGERLAGLEQAVPQQAEAIVARVADLRAAVVALRAGVTKLTYAAGEARGLRPRSLPTAVRLDLLDELEAEVSRLAEVAADPAEPAITPSLREREAIVRASHMAVGGITAAIVDLARIEKAEEYKHTAHTRGIPTHVLENAAAQAQF